MWIHLVGYALENDSHLLSTVSLHQNNCRALKTESWIWNKTFQSYPSPRQSNYFDFEAFHPQIAILIVPSLGIIKPITTKFFKETKQEEKMFNHQVHTNKQTNAKISTILNL